MEKQYTNDEIDLGLVFKKIGDAWRSFLVWIYNCIQFIIKNWILLLVLIAVGVGLGYFIKENYGGGYTTTLIIQNNFNSSNYVYDALEKLKSKEREQWFRDKYGFESNKSSVAEVEIEPIVNIVDLIENTEDDGRVLEQYLSEADFQEDLLLSEAFINEYQYHRVVIDFNTNASSRTVDAILNYLNDNEFYQEAKEIAIAETKTHIKSHLKSIEGIDAVFFSYKDSIVPSSNSQYTFQSKETTNIHYLIDEKRKLLDRISFLKTNLLKLNDVVYVINDKSLNYRMTLLDKMHLLLPILLIVLFSFFSWLKNFYKKMEHFANK